MDAIQYIVYKIYNSCNIYQNDQILVYSINNQIEKINTKINEIDNQISKKKDELSLFQTKFDEIELQYKESKDKLHQFNLDVNNKLNIFNNKFNSIFNEKIEVYDKTKNINNIFNEFKNLEDKITIFDQYNLLNKNIETNVLNCEISKEKLLNVKKELATLEKNKLDLSNKINQLNNVNTSLDIINN